jgi:hypothetical protein
MNERDIEMHELNDPLEHATGEVDAATEEERDDAEVGQGPSPADPEMRRDSVPDGF